MGSMRQAESSERHSGKNAPIGKSDCLLADIEVAIERGKPSIIAVDGAGQIWIDPEGNCYWQQVTDPETFFATRSRKASVKRAPLPGARLPSGPLEELLWDAAFLGSGGHLFEGNPLHDLIELSWWPNLTRVAHFQSTYALCAFLANRPSTMHLVFRALHVPEDGAYRFYNAALASGCLNVLKSRSGAAANLKAVESDDQETQDRAVVPFWSRLFNRISGL